MNKPVCYNEGKFVPLHEACISVNDLGVQRGYGIFDFLRVSGHVPLFLEDHLDRFFHSAAEMRLSVPEDRHGVGEIVARLIRENDLQHSGIRIILTGGDSPDGYQVTVPRLTIMQQAIQPPPATMAEKGIRLLSYPFQRQLPHVKTTDYLMAIWLQPWLKKGGGDDILYHQNGMVTECPRSNFFIITKEGTLATPASKMLKGITRKQVIGLAQHAGMLVEERDISMDDIRSAREAFITSSTKRIVPVGEIDSVRFPPYGQDSLTHKLWKDFVDREHDIISRAKNRD